MPHMLSTRKKDKLFLYEFKKGHLYKMKTVGKWEQSFGNKNRYCTYGIFSYNIVFALISTVVLYN